MCIWRSENQNTNPLRWEIRCSNHIVQTPLPFLNPTRPRYRSSPTSLNIRHLIPPRQLPEGRRASTNYGQHCKVLGKKEEATGSLCFSSHLHAALRSFSLPPLSLCSRDQKQKSSPEDRGGSRAFRRRPGAARGRDRRGQEEGRRENPRWYTHTGQRERSRGTQQGSPPGPWASHPVPTSSRAKHGRLGEAQRSAGGRGEKGSRSEKALTPRLPATRGIPPPQPGTGALRGRSSPGLRHPAAQSPPRPRRGRPRGSVPLRATSGRTPHGPAPRAACATGSSPQPQPQPQPSPSRPSPRGTQPRLTAAVAKLCMVGAVPVLPPGPAQKAAAIHSGLPRPLTPPAATEAGTGARRRRRRLRACARAPAGLRGQRRGQEGGCCACARAGVGRAGKGAAALT